MALGCIYSSLHPHNGPSSLGLIHWWALQKHLTLPPSQREAVGGSSRVEGKCLSIISTFVFSQQYVGFYMMERGAKVTQAPLWKVGHLQD